MKTVFITIFFSYLLNNCGESSTLKIETKITEKTAAAIQIKKERMDRVISNQCHVDIFLFADIDR